MRLADYANPDTGEAYPSMAKLVARCCISESTVHRCIQNLIDAGDIEKVSSGGFVNGRNETGRYRLRYTPESRRHTGSQVDTPPVSTCTETGSQNDTLTVLRERINTPPVVPQGGHTRNGDENKAKKKKLTVESALEDVRFDITLHQSLPFRTAWKRWLEHRLSHHKGPPTLQGLEEQMRKCARIGEQRAVAAIRHSMASNWLSIYEEKETAKRNTKPEPSL